jgi:hypothetical protein
MLLVLRLPKTKNVAQTQQTIKLWMFFFNKNKSYSTVDSTRSVFGKCCSMRTSQDSRLDLFEFIFFCCKQGKSRRGATQEKRCDFFPRDRLTTMRILKRTSMTAARSNEIN